MTYFLRPRRPALYGSPSGGIGGVLLSPSPAVPSSPGSGNFPHSLSSPTSSSRSSSLEACSPLSHHHLTPQQHHHLHHHLGGGRSSQSDLTNLESNWKSGGSCPTNGSHQQLEHHPKEFGAQNSLPQQPQQQQQQRQLVVERGGVYGTDYTPNPSVHGGLIEAGDTINNPNGQQSIISHSSPDLGNSLNNTANMMDTNCNMNMQPLGHPGPHGMGGGLHGRTNGAPGHHFKEEPVYGPGAPVGTAPGLGHSDQGLICSANNGSGMPQKEVCAGCQRPIEDRFLLKVMDNSWHEHCLQCSYCAEPLTHSCYVKDRKLLCKVDYDKYYGTKCSGCLQPIPPNELVMRAVNKVYHLNCFICAICGHQLQKGDQYVIKDEQLYCRLDFEKELALMQIGPANNDWSTSFSPKTDDDSSVDENDGLESNKGPKRPRTILTTSQRRKFKASFEVNPKPCRKVREALASETGLSVRVVQVWFQNQRAKVKKLARRQNTENTENTNNRKNNNNNNNNNTTKSVNKRTKKEDEEGEESNSQSESNITGNLYTPQPLTDNMYEGQMLSEPGMEGIDDVIMPSQGSSGPGSVSQGSLINPIDKLYSMQNSFFNE